MTLYDTLEVHVELDGNLVELCSYEG